MAEKNGARKTRIFLSYSRRDKAFVKKLNAAIDAAGIDAWVDWEGIPLSADWMKEITAAIESADALVFIISPDSLSSKVCAQELEWGLKNNKKIIAVLYREPEKRQKMHAMLSSINWVYMRPKKDDFRVTLPKLVDAIQTDLGWVQQHTRLLQRSTEWDEKKRNTSYLLQGSDLEDGERWMTESTSRPERAVVPLQAEYIGTSRQFAVERQRRLIAGISIAMLVSIAMGIIAIGQWRNALEKEKLANSSAATAIANQHIASTQQAIAVERSEFALKKENEARAQRSAARAAIYQERAGEMDTSTLLAIDSWLRLPSSDAEDVLRHNLSLMPAPIAEMKHAGGIWNIYVSADGENIVTASADGTACVWAPQGGKRFCISHGDEEVYYALLVKDNSLLVSAAGINRDDGSNSGSVGIWNGTDGSLIKKFEFNTVVNDVDISPDNKLLAVGRDDGILSIMDLNTQKEIFFIDYDAGAIYTVVFEPGGKWLGVGTSQGNVMLWRVMSGYSLNGPQHGTEVYNIVFSTDGKWLVSASADSTARLARTESGGQVFTLKHGDWVEDAAFAPDGSWFVTASDDNLVRVWDTQSGLEKIRMEHGGFVQRVEVSPNGQWILTTGYDRTARIWDAFSGALMLDISLDGLGGAVAFTPDGNRVVVGDRDGNVGIWDISSLNARIGYIEFPEFVHKAKFNVTGDWILLNSDDKNLWQIPTTQLTTLHDGSLGTRVLSFSNITSQLKVSPDSKWIVISETYGSRAVLYNLETKALYSLPHDSDISGLTFSSDGKTVATTNEGGTNVYIWDVASGQQIETIPFEETAFTSSYGPLNGLLAVGLADKIILLDTTNQGKLATLRQVGSIKSLTFSRDGAWLATTSSDGSIFVWDMKNETYSQPAHKFLQGGSITSLDFSSDDQWLASGGTNGFAYIWDLNSSEEIVRIPHSSSVSSVSFSPDGSQLVTVSRKIVQIWDTTLILPVVRQDIVEAACSRLTANFTPSTWEFFFGEEEFHLLCDKIP